MSPAPEIDVRFLAPSLLMLSLALGCSSAAGGARSGGSGGAFSSGAGGNGGAADGSGGAGTGASVSGGAGGTSGFAAATVAVSSTGTPSSASSTASSTTSSSGGGAPSSGDCQTDADCPHGPCVPVTAGGFLVCEAPPSQATTCTGSLDQCCPATKSYCPSGEECYAGPLVPACSGTPMPMHNQCGADQCEKDIDCAPNQICGLAGTLGLQIRACVTAYCKIDADCEAYPGGICAPVSDPCCGASDGLYCVYPGHGGCRSNADCAPTPMQPARYCAPGSDGTATCQPGAPVCPA